MQMLEIQKQIKELESDFINGSAAIARNALQILEHAAFVFIDDKNSFGEIAKHLKNAKKSMTAVQNLVDYAFVEFANANDTNEIESKYQEILKNIDTATETAVDVAFEELKGIFGNDLELLVCSYSGILTKTLLKLYESDCLKHVYACESAFNGFNYGEYMAFFCKSNLISCSTIPDSEIEGYIAKANAALIGADCLASSGGVINGYPSKSLAEKCYGKIPFFVIAESFKNNKTVLNNIETEPGFEKIECKYIEKIFTDEIWKFE